MRQTADLHPVEGPADLTTVTLRLEQLKWNYEGRQFSQKVAESKYALRFRAVSSPPLLHASFLDF